MIELCTFVYKFQLRYWWVLSSLLEQANIPKLHITTDLCKEDPYLDVEKIQKHFGNKLDLSFNIHTKDDMEKRGFIRTKNVKNAKAEWILFLDADDVFEPTFFTKLNDIISSLSDEDKHKIISIPRLTMPMESGYKIIDSVSYDAPIKGTYNRVEKYKTHFSRNGAVSAAGYFQLCHIPTMRQRGINSYVDGKYDVDLLSSKSYYRMKSDMVFRKKFSGIFPIRTLPPIIHINHYRRELDKQFDSIICH